MDIMKVLRLRGWPWKARLGLLLAICVAALALLFFSPAIPLGAHYHDFADRRALLGLPNALDVLSNLPFLISGLWGVVWLVSPAGKASFSDARERIPYLVFFTGVALTGVGSFWYHLAPSDARLPWDLLPMTCSFLSMVVVVFMERVSARAGLFALAPLLLLGLASVAYWYVSEIHGHGDYRFYLFVQFFSPAVLALLIALFPARYSGLRYLVLAFALFVAAKLFEQCDYQIFRAGNIVSGHSLKHATAGVACYFILRMLQVRRPLVQGQRVAAPVPQDQERLTLVR